MRAADGSKLERFKFHLLILPPTPARNVYLQEQPTQKDGQETDSRSETSHLLLGVGVGGVRKTLRRSLWVGTGVRGSERKLCELFGVYLGFNQRSFGTLCWGYVMF